MSEERMPFQDFELTSEHVDFLTREMKRVDTVQNADNRKLLWLALNTPAWKNIEVIGLESTILTEIENRLYPEYDGENVTFEDWGWKTPEGEIRYVHETQKSFQRLGQPENPQDCSRDIRTSGTGGA